MKTSPTLRHGVLALSLGLAALPWVAALVPLSAFLVALWAIALERRGHRSILVEQANSA